jgi:acetylornithine deacetylase
MSMSARAILQRLIAFDTTSRESNLELIDWVARFLAERGVEARIVPSPDGRKANMYARIGPETPGGVVLSGHTDVVPVDGQPWSTDPWTLTEKDGRLYGRGVADMKGFVALALSRVDSARAANLKRPLFLAFSYDEEVGCLGVPGLIKEMAPQIHTPSAVIVGEPTSMRVVSGHKGIATFLVEVEGKEAHSSSVRDGVSAIMLALPLMAHIEQMGREAAAQATASDFDPPHATMTIGIVEGGTAVNILARRCSFIWDLRCPPGEDPETYIAPFLAAADAADRAIKARFPQGGVKVTCRSATPALRLELEGDAERLARAITGDNALQTAAFATEAGLFQGAGWSSVVCGPGSIAQAHQPDEWIAIDQLDKGGAFLDALIARLS